MKEIVCIFLVLFATYCNAQSLRHPVSAGYPGIGAYSKNHIDVFSITSNQAALAGIKSSAAAVYGERRFLLDATSLYTAVIAFVTTKGNFALQADYFGFKNYNESQLGVSYARAVGSKIDVGVKFNYYAFRIPGYGTASTVNFEAGIVAHLTDKLHSGIHVYNPAGGNFFKSADERLGSAYTFGIGYEASEKLLVSTEMLKEEDLPVTVDAAIQYNFKKQFFVRAGVSSETANVYAGVGLGWKNLRLDMSVSHHPHLGFSPGILLIINTKSHL